MIPFRISPINILLEFVEMQGAETQLLVSAQSISGRRQRVKIICPDLLFCPLQMDIRPRGSQFQQGPTAIDSAS